MSMVFGNFDLSNFWDNRDYALREYVGNPLTQEMLASAEAELGYKVPATYIEFLKFQNGGIPRATKHKTATATSWASDHVAITGIFGADKSKAWSLCGKRGSRFMMGEWDYPDIGIYFCDCPSGGHDMLCLDYHLCGPRGEPTVVHVDQESDFCITPVADNFESFIRGLYPGAL